MEFKNINGQTFHKLTVYRFDSLAHGGKWHCLCECGISKIVSASNLVSGKIRSCGCDAQPPKVKNKPLLTSQPLFDPNDTLDYKKHGPPFFSGVDRISERKFYQ